MTRGLLLLLMLVSCAATPSPTPSPSPMPSVTASATATATATATASPSSTSPLRGAAQRILIAVPGYGDAAVTLPLGATGRRPIVVGLHGHRSRPDWQCRSVRDVFDRRAFGLCPQGKLAPAAPDDDEERYTFGDAPSVAKEIDAAIAALVRAYPDYVDPARPLVFGHSSGSYVGASIVTQDRAKWSHAIMNEGGANLVAAPGGARVLYACGTATCNTSATFAARGKTNARVAYAPGSGHRAYGPILDEIRDALPWLLDGDARFESK